MHRREIGQNLGHGGTVRISFPATAITDLGAFQRTLANVVEKLGCPKCASGLDCSFEMERNLVVNERLEFTSSPNLPSDPLPWKLARAVSVTLPYSVNYDLAKIQEVTAKVFGRLGCGECHSGFNILLQQELAFFADEQLNIHSY